MRCLQLECPCFGLFSFFFSSFFSFFLSTLSLSPSLFQYSNYAPLIRSSRFTSTSQCTLDLGFPGALSSANNRCQHYFPASSHKRSFQQFFLRLNLLQLPNLPVSHSPRPGLRPSMLSRQFLRNQHHLPQFRHPSICRS